MYPKTKVLKVHVFVLAKVLHINSKIKVHSYNFTLLKILILIQAMDLEYLIYILSTCNALYIFPSILCSKFYDLSAKLVSKILASNSGHASSVPLILICQNYSNPSDCNRLNPTYLCILIA